MPGRDGTGPMGAGTRTGRSSGVCTRANAATNRFGRGAGFDLGLACRRGFGHGFDRGFAANQSSSKTKKELLQDRKTVLQERLKLIDQQLESL